MGSLLGALVSPMTAAVFPNTISGGLTTTDATPTPVTGATLTLPEGSTYLVRAWFVARNVTDGNEEATYSRTCKARRRSAEGAVVEKVQSDYNSETDINWDGSIEANGNTIRPVVTGEAGKSIDWVVSLEYLQLLP